MYKKLEKECDFDKPLMEFIKAMYTDTFSTARVHNVITTPVETYKGLLQGALSSPIIFNLFINPLIKQLNKCKIGLNINKIKINNLFFADDIFLCANSEKKVQKLLDICSKWADKWKIIFNEKKSQLITNQKEIKNKILQNKEIIRAPNNTYKYLGIPISRFGIDNNNYIKKIRKRLYTQMAQMEIYCDSFNLNLQHRMIIYKSIVRSQIDYGIPVMYISKSLRNKLEKDQEYALKRILKINSAVNYQTMLSVLDILSISDRIDKLKIGFFYKLRNNNSERCLAKKVFENLWKKPSVSCVNIEKIQPMAELKIIMSKHNFKGLYDKNNNYTKKQIQKIINKEFRIDRKINTIKKIENQITRVRSDIRCKEKQNKKWIVYKKKTKQNKNSHPHKYFIFSFFSDPINLF